MSDRMTWGEISLLRHAGAEFGRRLANITPDQLTQPTLTTATSRTLKAEWTKFHTLPSTCRMTVMAIVTSIGLDVILCASQASQWATMSASQRQSFDPTACSLGGVFLVGVALLASLAVRSVTAE
jgi:hypothetical protein